MKHYTIILKHSKLWSTRAIRTDEAWYFYLTVFLRSRPLSKQIVLLLFWQFLKLTVSLRSTFSCETKPSLRPDIISKYRVSPAQIIPVIQNLWQFNYISFTNALCFSCSSNIWCNNAFEWHFSKTKERRLLVLYRQPGKLCLINLFIHYHFIYLRNFKAFEFDFF